MSGSPFIPVTGLDGVHTWRPNAPLRVEVSDAPAPIYSPDDEQRWAALRAANPRLHDGPILRVYDVDAAASVIRCRRDRYKQLAIQQSPTPPPHGVWMLGVKGWITGVDAQGHEHLLIARRGDQTRIYAKLWESAPAGGVDPPRETIPSLSSADLADTLAIEADEELGLDLDVRDASIVAVCRDFIAGSDDIFIGLRLPQIIDPRRSPSCACSAGGWEYSDSAWLARADAAAFDARASCPLVPPTRAVLRLLNWV